MGVITHVANYQPDLAATAMHRDHHDYHCFTSKYRVERAINSLLGLVEGIAIDRAVNSGELLFLMNWISDHGEIQQFHPINELYPLVKEAVTHNRLSEEAHADIVWLCRRLVSRDHFVGLAPDVQRLHAVLSGIAADRTIAIDELRGLSSWLEEHEHLRRTWPYEEACSLVTGILRDGRVSSEEHQLFLNFCAEFMGILDSRVVVNPPIKLDGKITGLCAVCPEISFENKRFCFTGASMKHSRKYLESLIARLGGITHTSVVMNLDYLIVGADGNPCWAYACYGRKIEQAVELRRAGAPLMIIHENDFHDAVADQN